MTFRKSIRNLIRAEGYKLRDYEGDAKTMDGNLIYVVRFCKENGLADRRLVSRRRERLYQ